MPMATIKHTVIQTPGLVVLSQKLMRVAAADNSAKRGSVRASSYLSIHGPGRVSYKRRVREC